MPSQFYQRAYFSTDPWTVPMIPRLKVACSHILTVRMVMLPGLWHFDKNLIFNYSAVLVRLWFTLFFFRCLNMPCVGLNMLFHNLGFRQLYKKTMKVWLSFTFNQGTRQSTPSSWESKLKEMIPLCHSDTTLRRSGVLASCLTSCCAAGICFSQKCIITTASWSCAAGKILCLGVPLPMSELPSGINQMKFTIKTLLNDA